MGTAHNFQPPPTKNPLRSSNDIPPIPLQIPHNTPSRHLRKHLLNPLYIRFSGPHILRTRSPRMTTAGSFCCCAEKEIAYDETTEDYDEEELWDVDCLVCHGSVALIGRCWRRLRSMTEIGREQCYLKDSICRASLGTTTIEPGNPKEFLGWWWLINTEQIPTRVK